jgi:hypothetical protein
MTFGIKKTTLLCGIATITLLAGCSSGSPVGPSGIASSQQLERHVSREGTIEIKRSVTYGGSDAARGVFMIRGELRFTVDPMENVKQEAFAVSLVLDATLAPVTAQVPSCIVYGAAQSVVTAAGKNPFSWDERFFVERDGGEMYLVLRCALESGSLLVEDMWIDCPSAISRAATR